MGDPPGFLDNDHGANAIRLVLAEIDVCVEVDDKDLDACSKNETRRVFAVRTEHDVLLIGCVGGSVDGVDRRTKYWNSRACSPGRE